MGKYIGHRLVARPELDNTFWTASIAFRLGCFFPTVLLSASDERVGLYSVDLGEAANINIAEAQRSFSSKTLKKILYQSYCKKRLPVAQKCR